jgi:hypothetical protein
MGMFCSCSREPENSKNWEISCSEKQYEPYFNERSNAIKYRLEIATLISAPRKQFNPTKKTA